jgi:hypothetical protein
MNLVEAHKFLQGRALHARARRRHKTEQRVGAGNPARVGEEHLCSVRCPPAHCEHIVPAESVVDRGRRRVAL